MIVCDDCDASDHVQVKKFFITTVQSGFFDNEESTGKNVEHLIFRVAKKPYSLADHIERIYYCFKNNLGEQLCGALLDLLIILDVKGQALARRMVFGSQSRLSTSQFQMLASYLKNPAPIDASQFNSRFALFTKGLLSSATLVQVGNNPQQTESDPLVIARDYIEFSQLDDAVKTLEQAILAQPERVELHEELLALYRSMRNKAGFHRTYQALRDQQSILSPLWKQASHFFYSLD